MIYCDNLSSIQLAKNPVFHARTKHIEVHYHFVHECVLSGEVELDIRLGIAVSSAHFMLPVRT